MYNGVEVKVHELLVAVESAGFEAHAQQETLAPTTKLQVGYAPACSGSALHPA